MPLPAASRIGPYEIVSPLGAGGMGEVYRARDTKLNRDVAIKVLAPAVVNDPDRLARFGREAQVLASLNHPNIAAIYGLEEIPSDVVSGFSRTTALVMELVEGEELSAHIARGPMPLADVLPIARQIADALEAAHELGIIHRDLKPANIKVRSDGTVKVLDFGLAKALDPARASNDNVANSPTLTAQGTQAGMILGTAAYMAPEQAKGRAVDRRADIWAFGAVVYEMLTGRRAFDGDDVSEILASVLKTDPNWASVPAETPASVRRLLRRCLERDPRKRLSSIGDARLELEEMPDDRTESRDQPAQPNRPGSRWPITAVVTAIVATLALGVPATWMVANSRTVAPPALLTRLSLLPPAGVPLFADSSGVTISPDGQWVAFVTGNVTFSNSLGGELYVRRISAMSATRVEGGAGAGLPFWSPDSRQIAFFADGKLKRFGVDGGRIEEICAAKDGRGGTWNNDGVIVFAPANAGGLMRVPANGGTPEPVTSLDDGRGETAHRFPVFLPDGRHFLYTVLPARAGNFDIRAGSIDGSTNEHVMGAESSPAFVAAGGSGFDYLVFSKTNGLVAQRFDADQRKLVGEPVSLGDESGNIASQFIGGRAAAASNNGSLAFLASPQAQTSLHWFSSEGRDIGTVSIPPGHYMQVAVSRDGLSAVLARRTTPTNSELWIADLLRGGASRVIDAVGLNYFAAWSPTGDRVAFASSREGPADIFIKSVDGGAPEERVVKSTALFKFPQSWSPDGKYVVYYDLNPATNTDLWVVPVTGDDRTPRPYLRSAANEQSGVISPDGKWMAYVSDDTGRQETYVTSFPTPGRKFRVSTTGTSNVYWRQDGKQLLMISEQIADILVCDVLEGAEFSATVPRVVGHLPNGVLAVDVTADLQRVLALSTESGNVSRRSITIVQNWKKALP